MNATNNVNTNRANTPKNRTENAHKTQNNSSSANHHSEHRYGSSQQPSHHSSSTSHHNRHNQWHHNSHHNRNNNRMASMGSGVGWPHMVNQNYPHFLLQQQNDPNTNQMKETQYLQSGQQVFLSSIANYGQ
ncbi:unnamed protein product, partial [Oppiella nova]